MFCGTVSAIETNEGRARRLPLCASCGAPFVDPMQVLEPECAPCREMKLSQRPLDESLEQAGSTVLREALRLFPAVEASKSGTYFGAVLRTLATTAGESGSAYKLIVVSELGFRVLSIPAGTILAGSELLLALEDEAMYAFVLARQIGHQKSGRVFRRCRSRRTAGALSAGFEWGISLITGGEAAFGRRRAEMVRELACLGYGAAHEGSADAFAVELLVRAGYDPTAGARFLSMLERRDLSARGPLAPFLDVRPPRSRRRAAIEALSAVHLESATLVRLNREVYRRASANLAQESLLLQPERATGARGTPRPE